jgi:hypothetical protein
VKILHFVCKLLEKNKIESPFKFEANRFGVFPVDLNQVLGNLASQNLIQVNEYSDTDRIDLCVTNKIHTGFSEPVSTLSPKIETWVQALNSYSVEQVVAISYYFFPETTTNSTIKPIINKTIQDMFSPLSKEFEESFEEKVTPIPISSEVKALYPQFNDLDARIHMMRSIGLDELPPIIPDIVDKSTGFLAKKYPLFKKLNLEELLEDARKR